MPDAKDARIGDLERYLVALQRAVEKTYWQGVSLGDASTRMELPEFNHCPAYSPTHSKNVEQLYLLLKQKTLNK